jgi:O-antigen/teichoic acid export membrane protein
MADLPAFLNRGIFKRLLQNPLTQRVLRNSGYMLTGNTTSAALGMVQSILAARLLGVAAFGLLGVITVFASVLNQLTSFRMSEWVISFVGEYSAQGQHRHAAAAFKAGAIAEMTSSILAYVLIILLAPLGARFLAHDSTTAWLFSLYGLMVLANLIAESSGGLLQYFDRYRLLATITVAQSALTLIMIVAAYIGRGGLVAIVLAYLGGKIFWAVAVTLAAVVEAGRQWGSGWWLAPLSLLRPRARGMLRFGVSTNLTGTLTLVTRDSELLWLGALSSPLQVGYYKVARAIINVLLIPVQPLISTTYREVAREIASRQWANVRYLLRSGSMISGAYSAAAGIALAVFGSYVVGLYGPTFLPYAYDCLLVLLLGVTVVNTLYWNRLILLPLGMPEYPTKVTLVAAVGKIALMFALVPSMGAMGMAISLSAFFLGTGSVLAWKTIRKIQASAEASTVAAMS